MSEQNEMDNNPVLDALALGVEPVAPPPDLRDRVLSAASGVGAVREGAEVVPLRRGRWRAGLRLPLGAVAAMVAIALLAGLAAGDLIGRGSAPPTPTSQAPRFFLQGHGPMSSVNGMVIDLRSEGFALVSFSGLPELPPGKVY
ncbi:MAG TPA: anti-sigma factor, partial [Candidatus Dormibacteraeota bacterium]|nr:anti-sigma factor [Candidatus Dormibacteraeota bacterium]